MGRAIADGAARSGAAVVVVGRSAERAAAVAAEIGHGCRGEAGDVLDEAQARTLFASIGAVDHLVIAAASVRPGPFRGDETAARASFEGKFWLQHRCARLAQAGGSILMFSGAYSRRPVPGMSAVAAVNGAVEALGRALALELAPVRVNVISPGLVQGTEAFAGMPEEARRGMIAGAAARLPAGLVGDAESVAGVALAILASPYMTGSVVDVDGGGLLV